MQTLKKTSPILESCLCQSYIRQRASVLGGGTFNGVSYSLPHGSIYGQTMFLKYAEDVY